MTNRIYVGNLSFKTTSDGLLAAFTEFGEVISSTVVSDRESGRSRGFGFVEMADIADAAKAIEAMHGKDLDGRTLNVNEAKPRVDRGASGHRS